VSGRKLLEEMLFCKDVSRATEEILFGMVNEFITKEGLNWDKCAGLFTDVAAAMTAKHSVIINRIKYISLNIKWIHCFIHREALATKKIQL
jgi:hypothetical protein